jgi:putative salt-induced outer membrane protein
MTHSLFIAGATAAALSLAASAGLAQTTLTGIDTVDDRIDDLEREARRDLDRADDPFRFGSPEYREGLSGSASLGFTGRSGLTDSGEFSLGARLRAAQGPFVQTIGVVADYSETESVKTRQDIFAIYDASYFFNEQFYGFVLGRLNMDGLADAADEVKIDGFLGFGPGFRVVNTPDLSWRVQAGIGVSYLEDGAENSDTETGYIASSRFYWRLSDSVFATNDTDVLHSDTATRINNDLGLNFRMTEIFATRVSYLTEYNDARDPMTENKLGVSLVYSF